MKFGPKFKKMFIAYPDIDKSKLTANRVTLLSRADMYMILKAMKKAGLTTPAQPTRTPSYLLRHFIYDEMRKLTR